MLEKLENMPPNVINNNIKNVAKLQIPNGTNSPKKITASAAKYKAYSQFLTTNFRNIYTLLIDIIYTF